MKCVHICMHIDGRIVDVKIRGQCAEAVSLSGQTQVFRPGGWDLYPLSCLSSPDTAPGQIAKSQGSARELAEFPSAVKFDCPLWT